MTKEDYNKFVSLVTEAISSVWDEAGDDIDLPLIGDDVIAIAGETAVNIFLAIADTQSYLKREGIYRGYGPVTVGTYKPHGGTFEERK